MRKKLFKWHSYGALIAMIPLLVISITGSILVFKVEIDSLLRPHHMTVNVTEQTERASIDDMMLNVLTANPEHELGGWELYDNKERSDAAYLIKRGTEEWYKVYINQYTNEILSQPQHMTHYITDWLLELHYTFLLHLTGAWVGFAIALIMLFLGISGVILYRKFWQKFFTFRVQAAKRILFSDIHKFVGIISSPILIIMAFTGGYWNIAGILHEINEHGEGGHVYITQPLHSPNISFERLRLEAQSIIPTYQAGYLAMPHEPDKQITFYGSVESNNPLHSEYGNTVTFDKITGEFVKKNDLREASFLYVFIDSFRKLHFGYFGGLTTRIIWCVIGFMPVILAFTGFYLYWTRRKSKKTASKNRQALSK